MFKVMTWNVENLFRPGSPSGPPSQALYNAKIDGLALTVNEEAPDVLALQEIGDPAALEDLVKKLGGTWFKHVSAHQDARGIRVAWLARRAISEAEDIFEFPPKLRPVQVDDDGHALGEMGRGGLAISVRSESGVAIRLVTVHLKSKLLTFPGGRFNPHDEEERARFAAYALYRRAAEAATMRVWVTDALGGNGENRGLILAGDLNDTEQAATTQLLLGPPGSEIGTRGFDQRDAGDHQRLWNLAPLMPAGSNYSRINQGRKELIDHILVSAALVKPLDSIEVEALLGEPLPSVTTNPNALRQGPPSDHAPVVAKFSNL
jgi:endonuclease/exonuclease/phosphatase family metal-dependent hydrolase